MQSRPLTLTLIAASLSLTSLAGCSARLVPRTDDPKVMVCHKEKTISISRSALDTHLDHGDRMGACR